MGQTQVGQEGWRLILFGQPETVVCFAYAEQLGEFVNELWCRELVVCFVVGQDAVGDLLQLALIPATPVASVTPDGCREFCFAVAVLLPGRAATVALNRLVIFLEKTCSVHEMNETTPGLSVRWVATI